MSDLTTDDINKVLGVQEAEPIETQEPEKPEEVAEEAAPEAEEVKEEKPETPAEPEAKKETRLDKHPRFIRVQKELSELREWRQKQEEVAKQAPQVKEEVKQQVMPEAFTKLFGSNEEAWSEWQKLGLMTKDEATSMTKSIIEQSFREQQEKAEAVQKANEQAIAFVEEEFSDLAEETGLSLSESGDTSRNRILDFVERHSLYDNKGLPNVKLAYNLMSEMGAFNTSDELVQTKKSIVAKTAVKNNSNTQESDIMTTSKLRAIDKRGGLKALLR